MGNKYSNDRAEFEIYGGKGAMEIYLPAAVWTTGAGDPTLINGTHAGYWTFTCANSFVAQGLTTTTKIPGGADTNDDTNNSTGSSFDIYAIIGNSATADTTVAFTLWTDFLGDGSTASGSGANEYTFTGTLGTANGISKIAIATAGEITGSDFTLNSIMQVGFEYRLANVTGAAGTVSTGPIKFFGLSFEPRGL